MEELLKQIVKNTSQKWSNQFIFSSRKSNFSVSFKTPINLHSDKKYEIALTNFETYYSFPTIDESNNKFVYSIKSKNDASPEQK